MFLGHNVNEHGIRFLQDKVNIIQMFPQHQTTKKLREILGLIHFYLRFIPNCSAILQPLNRFLTGDQKKSTPLEWKETAVEAFEIVKEKLAETTALTN